MTKKMGRLVLGLWLLAMGGPALAADCGPSCGMQKLACVETARVDRLACKSSCRESAAPGERGACIRSCSTTFRTAKGTCTEDHATCRATCTPGDHAACPGECGRAQGTCARNVTRVAQSCRAACGRVPFERGTCLSACAVAARLGMSGCHATFEQCLVACGGSPSGAFLD